MLRQMRLSSLMGIFFFVSFFISVKSYAVNQSTEHQSPEQVKEKNAIRSVINHLYDTPEHKVVIAPIIVEGKHALASWVHASIGGRVVMHQKENKEWEVVLCSGKAVTDAKFLMTTGMPDTTAKILVNELVLSEAKLGEDKIALFDSFKAVVRGSHQAMHENQSESGNHLQQTAHASEKDGTSQHSTFKNADAKKTVSKRNEHH